ELGAEVMVAAVDLSDESAIAKTVTEVQARWGKVVALVHSAGVVDRANPAFIRKHSAGIARVLAPKGSGLTLLDKSLRGIGLEMALLYSSVSAVIARLAVGQSDYAMANSYLDYFAESEQGKCRVLSIEWPNWQETGMGEVKSLVYQESGLLSHT